MTTKIMFCECAHEYQDKKYGKNRRVFNATAKDNPKIYRCTVCETTKTTTNKEVSTEIKK